VTWASSTSSTTTSTITTLATPRNARTGNGGGSSSSNNNDYDDKPNIEWLELYERLKRNPSKATRNSDYEHTMVIAKDKSFNDLTEDQQALLMFMIKKDMDKTFNGGGYAAAKILVKALNPKTKEYD
jgi:hypothetical protein